MGAGHKAHMDHPNSLMLWMTMCLRYLTYWERWNCKGKIVKIQVAISNESLSFEVGGQKEPHMRIRHITYYIA